jgi:hypothetical protein
MPFGDALEADVEDTWRSRTDIALQLADRAGKGEVTVLGDGVAAVVPANVAVAGLRALGLDVPAQLSNETLGESR